MYDLLIREGTLVGENSLQANYFLGILNGQISLLDSGEEPAARSSFDASGHYIAPGFIDLHVHGGYGADILDGVPDSLETIACFHGKNGTTGFLGTIAAAPFNKMIRAVANISGFTRTVNGARILGSHLEGPFLNTSCSGALNRDYFREPSLPEARELIAAGSGSVKVITLAPELPGMNGIIAMLNEEGIVTALGHSRATFLETAAAAKAGLKHLTHVFNAMSGLHHRDPGPAGAFLYNDNLSAEVIADGIHIHPFILKMLFQLKGHKLALVSDAIAAAGLSGGNYLFSGQKISVSGGSATLAGGRLAGSTITMLDAVKNMISKVGLSLPEAVRLASINPAGILGLTQKGHVKNGYDADLVVLDQRLDPVLVTVEGRVVFSKKSTT